MTAERRARRERQRSTQVNSLQNEVNQIGGAHDDENQQRQDDGADCISHVLRHALSASLSAAGCKTVERIATEIGGWRPWAVAGKHQRTRNFPGLPGPLFDTPGVCSLAHRRW